MLRGSGGPFAHAAASAAMPITHSHAHLEFFVDAPMQSEPGSIRPSAENLSKNRAVRLKNIGRPAGAPHEAAGAQYRFAIGSSLAGNSVMIWAPAGIAIAMVETFARGERLHVVNGV